MLSLSVVASFISPIWSHASTRAQTHKGKSFYRDCWKNMHDIEGGGGGGGGGGEPERRVYETMHGAVAGT